MPAITKDNVDVAIQHVVTERQKFLDGLVGADQARTSRPATSPTRASPDRSSPDRSSVSPGEGPRAAGWPRPRCRRACRTRSAPGDSTGRMLGAGFAERRHRDSGHPGLFRQLGAERRAVVVAERSGVGAQEVRAEAVVHVEADARPARCPAGRAWPATTPAARPPTLPRCSAPGPPRAGTAHRRHSSGTAWPPARPSMSSAAPQAHPIFQPVTLNIFAALEMVIVRSAMPG